MGIGWNWPSLFMAFSIPDTESLLESCVKTCERDSFGSSAEGEAEDEERRSENGVSVLSTLMVATVRGDGCLSCVVVVPI